VTFIIRGRKQPAIPPDPPTRDAEMAQYTGLYKLDNYRMGQKRRDAVQQIVGELTPRGTLLDVSTGRGETLAFASAAGHDAYGTEVVPDLLTERVTFAPAHELPFHDGQFDHVTCFDVLEHLVEEDVHACLREMRRVAKVSVTASASERPSWFGERDLHISKRPAAEWEKAMAAAWGGSTRIINAGGSPCWQWYFPSK